MLRVARHTSPVTTSHCDFATARLQLFDSEIVVQASSASVRDKIHSLVVSYLNNCDVEKDDLNLP